ncbi:hypothetical protein ES703_54894 [subsurface metagenome]
MVRGFLQTVLRVVDHEHTAVGSCLKVYVLVAHADVGNHSALLQALDNTTGKGLEHGYHRIGIAAYREHFLFGATARLEGSDLHGGSNLPQCLLFILGGWPSERSDNLESHDTPP